MPINSRNNLNISLSLFSPSKTGWPWSEQSKPLPKTMQNGKLWPKISIVTPSFNQVQFIEETIRSVLLQNYPNLEYIIIDGGSTDGSVEIIKKYEKYLTYWVSEPDSGQSEAINKGWKIATGDIIAWLNSDDMYMPYALSTIASMYAANPDKIIFQGSCNNIDIEGNHLFTYPAQEMDSCTMLAICGGNTAQPSIFLNKTVLESVGFLDTNISYAMDWDYWIRIGLHYSTNYIFSTNAMLSMNRIWHSTKTNLQYVASLEECRMIISKYTPSMKSYPYKLKLKNAGYRSSYYSEAMRAKENGNTLHAYRCLLSAWKIEPFSHLPRTEFILFCQFLFGKKATGKVRHILSKLSV